MKSEKQVLAVRMMNENLHTLLYGGARSGKTHLIIRQIILRALKAPSDHLVLRLRFTNVIQAICLKTFPKVMLECFPDVPYHMDRTRWFATLWPKSGKGKAESQIWFGGTDDPARIEGLLGKEYVTIYCNEISQMHWDVIPTVWTRCAQNVPGLKPKMYYDCNPPSRNSWAYSMFFKAESPAGEKLLQNVDLSDPDSEMVPLKTAQMLINPFDNPGLSLEYRAFLNGLPQRARDRYRDGLFLSDVEGALWTDEMIMWAEQKEHGEIEEVIVSLDPATTNNEHSDEWGITVLARDEFGNGGVLEDLSGVMSTKDAAQTAVNAYFRHKANCVVVETNQGGDMCVDILHNVNQSVVVEKVTASKGKRARAEPVSMKYEEKKIWHAEKFPQLVEQQTTWVPATTQNSPDRVDSVVTGFTYLIVGRDEDVYYIGGGDPGEWRAAQ